MKKDSYTQLKKIRLTELYFKDIRYKLLGAVGILRFVRIIRLDPSGHGKTKLSTKGPAYTVVKLLPSNSITFILSFFAKTKCAESESQVNLTGLEASCL